MTNTWISWYQWYMAMNRAAELGEFLKSRRARLEPADVGIGESGRWRRVVGLRREEVAPLAGIGVDYYTRLEQGRVQGVSNEVLDAVADALRLTPAEREYVRNLSRPPSTEPASRVVRPAVQDLLDSLADTPAYILGPMADILAWNQLASALFVDFAKLTVQQRNWSHLLFEDERIQALFDDPMIGARDNVAFLRLMNSRYPNDTEMTDLIARMLTRSTTFRDLWDKRNVAEKSYCEYLLHHPLVGDMTLGFQGAFLPDEPGKLLVTYTAARESASADRLRQLSAHIQHPDRTHPTPIGGRTH
ncbi:helix-turn-helix transcriptional regulator [Nocardia camponoti]|uniref:DNA-binding protein n=1 Tax=Nocardia camponoti TaxID=1616106 RepID=A0A917V3M7_9NOCA|nr:helix-turn-helix transcriptional regulator [Nocardia camponoti]GGK32609.1 DNA-binding protein [Nocardia camponoti]